jgi:cell division protein FtsI (penicillin-binding protein 3)
MTPRARRPRKPAARPGVHPGIRRRLAVAAAVLLALLSVVAVRAYSMQVTRSEHYRALANRQHLHTVEVPAPRGPIYDRHGVELAVTAGADSIWANPREILDVPGTARVLAELLEIEPGALERKLEGSRYFVWLERHTGVDRAERVRHLGLPGIHVASEPRRFYPGRDLAGTVIGFADIDGRGLEGIELAMDDLLAGHRGITAGVRDASGGLMLPDPQAEAEPGHALTLTIDRAIQHIAERALDGAMTEHGARAGIALVLEIATGDVLAMANRPGYDPNHPDPSGGARNRAITDAYEIGSVMKLFSVAAALEAGVVTPDTEFDVYNGRMRLGRRVIRDSFRDERLTVTGIIKRSSNIGSIQIAQRLEARRLHDALIRYRFGKPTGIELAGERAGLIRPAERWRPSDLAVISYGYGMTVTPLQAAAGVAAIGNGGVYHAPRLVRQIADSRGTLLYRRRPAAQPIMRPEVADQMLAMMRRVFDKGKDGGTARDVDLGGFTAGGKTGTARKIDPATGAYGDLYMSSFAGVAPLNDPRVAVLVIIDEPTSGHYYGSTVAGGAFAQIVSETLRTLGVPPVEDGDDEEEDEGVERGEGSAPAEATEENAEETAAPAPRAPEPGEIATPDFAGLGISAALERGREAGIAVEIRGGGRAIEQSPAAGEPMPRGGSCQVTFALPGARVP